MPSRIDKRERFPEPMVAEVVFFDVGGTLVFSRLGHLDLLHQSLRVIGYRLSRDIVARANDLARQAVARRRRRHAAHMDTRTAGRMWLDHLAEALELDLQGTDLEAELSRAIREIEVASQVKVDPDAVDTLAHLRQRGYRLGVISNWSPDLPDYLTKHGLRKFFEVIVASEVVGAAKPHREIFLRALTAMGCPARKAVHVGDDYWADVVGARDLGISAVLLDRQREGTHFDCPTITRLAELGGLLAPHAI